MKLILLPGLDGTGVLFEPLLSCLPARLDAQVLPLPNDVPHGYDELVDHVFPLLPRGEPFVLLGESFSGPLVLLLASRRPVGLSGVILCASFITNPTMLPAPTQHLAAAWLFRLTPAFVQAKALLGGYATPELMALLKKAHGAVTAGVMAGRVKSVLTVDVRDALRSCPVPVAYLQGTRDLVVRRRSLQKIAEVRPDVRVFPLPAPHLVLQTQPLAAAEAISNFLSDLS